jgi:hypothetical protein
MLNGYLKKIAEIANRGDATEESYYATLANLLNQFAQSTQKTHIRITKKRKKTTDSFTVFTKPFKSTSSPDFQKKTSQIYILKSIAIQKEIDTIYSKVEKEIIEF